MSLRVEKLVNLNKNWFSSIDGIAHVAEVLVNSIESKYFSSVRIRKNDAHCLMIFITIFMSRANYFCPLCRRYGFAVHILSCSTYSKEKRKGENFEKVELKTVIF